MADKTDQILAGVNELLHAMGTIAKTHSDDIAEQLSGIVKIRDAELRVKDDEIAALESEITGLKAEIRRLMASRTYMVEDL